MNIFNLYGVVAGIYLLGLYILPENIVFGLKPLLLPLLIAAVWKHRDFPTKSMLLSALFFSWVGDVVIAYAFKGEIFFILGLVSFLIAHLFYIGIFAQSIKTKKQIKPYISWAFVVLAVYLLAFIGLLYPHLNALKIPVIIYAMVIGTMMAMALRGCAHWRTDASTYIAFGALFFVISDSTLAVNKFYTPLSAASFWIMATYLLAQYALTKGVLESEK